MTILSDWDVLAVDERGSPCNGVSEPSPCGVRLEVHQNWVNVLDDSGWRQGAASPPPVVVTATEGEITYLDAHLVACRGPRRGVYMAGWFMAGRDPVGLAAAACYGWDGDRYAGADGGVLDFLARTLRAWAAAGRVPDLFGRLPLARPLRFNQGDAFVARRANFPVPVTEVGEAETPLAVTWQRKQGQLAKEEKKDELDHAAGAGDRPVAADAGGPGGAAPAPAPGAGTGPGAGPGPGG